MGRRSSALFLISFLFFLFASCKKGQKKAVAVPADSASIEQPEFVMSPFHIQAFGSPGLEWELRAPQARAYTSMNVMRAEQIDLTLYEQGQKSTTIRSDRGIFCIQNQATTTTPPDPRVAPKTIEEEGTILQSGDMLLSGNVVVVSTDGSKLTTDWLHFQKQQEIIRSSAPVQIVRADSITEGTGLEATPDLKRVRIFNQTLVIKGTDGKK